MASHEPRPRALARDPEPDPVAHVGATDPWGLFFWARYTGIPLLSLFALVGPVEMANRPLVAFLTIAYAVPATLVVDRLRARRPALPGHLVELDSLLAAFLVHMEPSALAGMAVVLTADMAMTASIAGRKTAQRNIALGAPLVFAGAVTSTTPDGYLLAMFSITGFLLAIVVGNVADGERSNRRRIEHLLAGVDGIVWEVQLGASARVRVEGDAEGLLGVPNQELEGVSGWLDLIHLGDQERVMDFIADLLAGRHAGGPLEYRMIARGGEIRHVHDHIRIERDRFGQPLRVSGLMTDVTRRRQAERENRYFRNVIENIQTALLVVTLDERSEPPDLYLVAANPAARRLLGRAPSQYIDTRLLDAFPNLRGGPIPERLVDTARAGVGFDIEMPISPEPDAPVFALHTFALSNSAAGMAMQDVTDRAKVQARLRHQALHDSLTGLPNRLLLNEQLNAGLNRARREQLPVAVLIMDLNHFKEVNDTLGHHSGDALLISVATRLRDSLREADTIARLGGDEFAILLTTDAARDGAEAVARKITRIVEQPIEIDGVSIQVGASIGIALYPDHAEDSESLARKADVAMYVAKRSGSSHAVYAPEDDHSSIRRLTLLGELRQAIAANQLVLHHQPTIDLRTGRILRTEALLRWNHPEHGLLPPKDFLELAEMSGVIQPLTRWVLRQSIRQVKWLSANGSALRVAVNVNASAVAANVGLPRPPPRGFGLF